MQGRGFSNDDFEKKRFLNFLRGIAVFVMLWGHCIQYCCGGQFDFYENFAFKTIYSFHMPLFMLISGYLFFFSAQNRKTVELIEYKTKSMLYPILMCSVLNYILTVVIISLFKKEAFSFGGVSVTSLWFLWSVLSCSLAVALAVKPFKNKILQAVFVVLGIGLVAILPCWEKNIYMYPYFVIGYLFATIKPKFKKVFFIVYIVSCVIFVLMLFWFKKKHYIYTSGLFGGANFIESFKIDMFRWAIGLFGSIAVIFICTIIFKFIKGIKLVLFIESLGQNSLAVYALSVSFLSFWLPLLFDAILDLVPAIAWNKYIWLYNLIITPIIAVFYAIFLLLIIKLMKKIKIYRLICGR